MEKRGYVDLLKNRVESQKYALLSNLFRYVALDEKYNLYLCIPSFSRLFNCPNLPLFYWIDVNNKNSIKSVKNSMCLIWNGLF